MRFGMAFSCGKDSTLALHELLALGHEPVCLITMLRRDQQRSWFQGADREMLNAYSENLGIPIVIVESDGTGYATNFELALIAAKASGATVVAFGDIDIAANRRWQEDRCAAAGLVAHFPLWQRDRVAAVTKTLALGYKCMLKSVATAVLPVCRPGQFLSLQIIQRLQDAGLDACGENGEYHTLVTDGPIFRQPLPFRYGEELWFDDHVSIRIGLE